MFAVGFTLGRIIMGTGWEVSGGRVLDIIERERGDGDVCGHG
jgi:hypothetical protein